MIDLRTKLGIFPGSLAAGSNLELVDDRLDISFPLIRVDPGFLEQCPKIRGRPTLFCEEFGNVKLWPQPDQLYHLRERTARVSLADRVRRDLASAHMPGTISFVQELPTPLSLDRLAIIRNGAKVWAGHFLDLVHELCDAAKLHAVLSDYSALSTETTSAPQVGLQVLSSGKICVWQGDAAYSGWPIDRDLVTDPLAAAENLAARLPAGSEKSLHERLAQTIEAQRKGGTTETLALTSPEVDEILAALRREQ